MKNLGHFGYGIKGFRALDDRDRHRAHGRPPQKRRRQTIIDWGRDMLASPVELLEGVARRWPRLPRPIPLILVTKGDLLHQESKLARSGLGEHFTGIEIVSEKNAADLPSRHDPPRVAPDRFVMVGNSLRSDILPVLDAGAQAVHMPVRGDVDPRAHRPRAAARGPVPRDFAYPRSAGLAARLFVTTGRRCTTLDGRCRPPRGGATASTARR